MPLYRSCPRSGSGDTANRLLDVAARQSNVAEFTIVHLPERFDRRPTVQIARQRERPGSEPAQKSAGS